jgi:hypothetical protein
MVTVETVHAEVTATDPGDVVLYIAKFNGLEQTALAGEEMRGMVEGIRDENVRDQETGQIGAPSDLRTTSCAGRRQGNSTPLEAAVHRGSRPGPPGRAGSRTPSQPTGSTVHHHAYLWVGDKRQFDRDVVRRPPEAGGTGEFAGPDVPPIETAYWLLKPASLIRGTWEEPERAGEWLGGQLGAYAERFGSSYARDGRRRASAVASAVERLGQGEDVSLGHHLGRPLFLSVALVTCSPNRTAKPHGAILSCPRTRQDQNRQAMPTRATMTPSAVY